MASFDHPQQYNYAVAGGGVIALDGRIIVDGSREIRKDDAFLIENAGLMLQLIHNIQFGTDNEIPDGLRQAMFDLLEKAYIQADIDIIGVGEGLAIRNDR